MKHLTSISQAAQLPAFAIDIPEDVIRRVQEVDFLQLALNLLPAAIDALIADKGKTET